MTKNFFVFEGIDGSGKSTLVKNVLDELLKNGNDVVSFFEPTKQSDEGKLIRKILQGEGNSEKNNLCLLFKQDRLWNLDNQVRPALENNSIVLLDRYFFSTAAYQAKNTAEIDTIIEDHVNDSRVLLPEKVFLNQIDPIIALERITNRLEEKSIFEKQSELERINNNYNYIFHKKFPFEVIRINSLHTAQQMAKIVVDYIQSEQ